MPFREIMPLKSRTPKFVLRMVARKLVFLWIGDDVLRECGLRRDMRLKVLRGDAADRFKIRLVPTDVGGYKLQVPKGKSASCRLGFTRPIDFPIIAQPVSPRFRAFSGQPGMEVDFSECVQALGLPLQRVK